MPVDAAGTSSVPLPGPDEEPVFEKEFLEAESSLVDLAVSSVGQGSREQLQAEVQRVHDQRGFSPPEIRHLLQAVSDRAGEREECVKSVADCLAEVSPDDQETSQQSLKVVQALREAKDPKSGLSERIHEYGITSEEDRQLIAETVVEYAPEDFLRYQTNFELSQGVLLSFEAAKKMGGDPYQNLMLADVRNPEEGALLLYIAMEDASDDFYERLPDLIKKFGVDSDEYAQLKFYRWGYKHYGDALLPYLDELGFTDDKGKFAVVMDLFSLKGPPIDITKVHFQDPKFRIDLILEPIRGDQVYPRYSIEEVLERYAKLELPLLRPMIGDLDFEEFLEAYLKKYPEISQEERIQMAFSGIEDMKTMPRGLIQMLGIEDEAQRFELAKRAVQKFGESFFYSFQEFQIQDQDRIHKLYNSFYKGKPPPLNLLWVGNFDPSDKRYQGMVSRALQSEIDSMKAQPLREVTIGKGIHAVRGLVVDDQPLLLEFLRAVTTHEKNGRGLASGFWDVDLRSEELRAEFALESAMKSGEDWEFSENFRLSQESLAAVFSQAVARSPALVRCPQLDMDQALKASSTPKQQKVYLECLEKAPEIRRDEMKALLMGLHFAFKDEPKKLEQLYESGFVKRAIEMRHPFVRRNLLQSLMREPKRFDVSKLRRPADLMQQWLANEGMGKAAACLTKRDKTDVELVYKTVMTLQNMASFEALRGMEDSLLQVALEGNSIMKKRERLTALTSLMGLGQAQSLLPVARGEISIEEAFSKAFSEEFGLGQVEGLAEKYPRTFGNFRNFQAVSVYYAGLSSFTDFRPLESFRTWMEEVLTGEFQVKRYEGSPQLDRIFQKKPGLKEKWMRGETKALSISGAAEEEGIEWNFEELLRKKLFDDQPPHISHEEIPDVLRYLNAESVEEKQSILKEVRRAAQKPDAETYQRELINLIRSGEKGVKVLPKLKAALEKHFKEDLPELHADVKGWMEQAKPQKTAPAELKLVDTDNPNDFLLMGTEVEGSCQRVDGYPHLNQGLTGKMMRGENRLLAIKDPATHQIVGRMIMTLLEEDTEDGEPCLLIEPIYPDVLSPALKEKLVEFAKERAGFYGLPLYSTCFDGEETDVTLVSTGARAEVVNEYVDSAGGIREGGVYSVSGLNRL